MKPKIGILTTFSNMNPEYSLAGVVRSQINLLQKYGYEVVLFTLDNFKEEVSTVAEHRPIVPQLILEPYGAGDISHIEQDVAKAQKAFEENMQDIDVMLSHDIIFINSYLPYNIALRNAIETKLGHIKWLHWMHSGPSFKNLDGSVWDNLYTLPKNSKLVYMNHTDVIRAAEMYHVFPKDVRVVFNPMDIRDLYDFHYQTWGLIEDNDLMSPEFLVVYPLSTTRMTHGGKQLHKVIPILGELKKLGHSVKLVVPNAHANGQNEKLAIEEMYQLGYVHGLERHEIIFTSLYKEGDKYPYEQGVPHYVVKELFLLSNLFIFPSYSENCPLALLEAMAGNNLLVLNQDFPAMKDFGGQNALYFRFSSTVAPEPNFPDGINKYYADVAKLIVSEFDQNKALKAQTDIRRRFNIDWIAKRQLLPLIQEVLSD